MTGDHANSNNSVSQKPGDPLHEDLLSTALRYVLDELTVEESSEFECRLLGRQDAREAVAEAVALCQPAKHAIDAVMRDALYAANGQPGEGVEPRRPAAQMERVWLVPAAWASLVVAASFLLAIVFAGIRGGDSFGPKPGKDVSAAGVAAEGRSTAAGSLADGRADHGKRLLLAWLNFFPLPNDAASTTDATVAASDGEDQALAADEENFTVDLEGGAALADDEDVIVRVDSAMAARDWVYEAVTAEPSPTAGAQPREG